MTVLSIIYYSLNQLSNVGFTWCFGAFNGISPMSASYYFSAACHLYDAFLAEYADSIIST